MCKSCSLNRNANIFCINLAYFNFLSANPTKWPNTLKQFVGNLPTNFLSLFDHFAKLALKGLKATLQSSSLEQRVWNVSQMKSHRKTPMMSFFSEVQAQCFVKKSIENEHHHICFSWEVSQNISVILPVDNFISFSEKQFKVC